MRQKQSPYHQHHQLKNPMHILIQNNPLLHPFQNTPHINKLKEKQWLKPPNLSRTKHS